MKKFLIFPIILFILVAVFDALQWEIINLVSPFIFMFIQIPVWIFVLVVFIVLIVKFTRAKSKAKAIICTVLLAALIFVPFDDFYENIRFSVLNSRMESAASELIYQYDDKLNANEAINNIKLDKADATLSRGGNVDIIKENGYTMVFFYTYRGVSDNYSGYYYITPAPDSNLDERFFSFYNNCIQAVKEGDSWYFCAYS